MKNSQNQKTTSPSDKKLSSLSIFFPAYNEEGNIEGSITQAMAAAEGVTDTYEIIVVNDASKDDTAGVVKRLQATHGEKIRLVTHEKNKGYGGALITGFNSATLDYIFFTDADLQFDLSELELLVAHIDQHDAVIGYRKVRQDPLIRLVYARGWNIINRILFGLKVRDIDGAFKLFKREVVANLPITSQGNMISAEILIHLMQNNVSMKEVPVTHFPRTEGYAKGANFGVIMRALKEVSRLFFGKLGEPSRRQMIAFGLFGIFNTVLDIGLYYILTHNSSFFAANYVATKAGTFLLGTISSFLLNKYATFKQKTFNPWELVRFYTVVAGSTTINALATYLLIDRARLPDLLSVVIATGLAFVFTFVFIKTWVFVAKSSRVKKPVVGFTCGSFDLLHSGHVQMFKDCKEYCDYLIVGLQSDPSVDRKTKNKPVQTLAERLEVTRAIRWIDEVVLYDTEADLLKLLRTLPIDVRIIGADWKNKNFTGSELPLKVVFNERNHPLSTSELRKRVYQAELEKLQAGGYANI